MHLTLADDFELVKACYEDVIENTPNIGEHARWVYGRHPDDELLQSYVERGEMYLLADGPDVAGMVAIVMGQDADYDRVHWAVELASDQVATLHLLAVLPKWRGRALGSVIVKEAVEVAKRRGKKVVRLDVLRSNTPARHMYERAGFSYRGSRRLYIENNGWLDFLYYERPL